MIEAFSTPAGLPSLRIDGIAFHSPYDPVREAERFVESALGAEEPSTILLLGEGLGYVGRALARLRPAARVIGVIHSTDVAAVAGPSASLCWHPAAGSTLADFLRAHLGELDVEGLRVLEWPPSARIFPVQARKALDDVRQVLQELNGSFATTMGAGRLWIRNSIANFLSFDGVLAGAPCRTDRPILIAAPGPSLEQSVETIRSCRAMVDLWALPSSALFLSEAGLPIDLVVMTDPGYYAMHHLHFSAQLAPVAMPLSAARGAWKCAAERPFLLAQPVPFEQALLSAAAVPAPLVAPHGTVAATAIDLALASTQAPVIVAGLDLCMRDIAAHARPNAFDRLLHLQASRLTPHYSLTFKRAADQRSERLAGTRTSPALRTYAGWFDDQTARAGASRLFRLHPSDVALRGFHDVGLKELPRVLSPRLSAAGGPRFHPLAKYPGRAGRCRIVQDLMAQWRKLILEEQGQKHFALFSEAISLAYYIEPQLLLEARRKARRESPDARSASQAMFSGCIQFIEELSEKTRVC